MRHVRENRVQTPSASLVVGTFGIPATNGLVKSEPLRMRCYAFRHIDQLRVLVEQPVNWFVRKEFAEDITVESQAQYSAFHPTARSTQLRRDEDPYTVDSAEAAAKDEYWMATVE
jgi:hypothetical protein